MTGEQIYSAIPMLLNHLDLAPDAIVLNDLDRARFSDWSRNIFMEGTPRGDVTSFYGLAIYGAEWIEPGHALVLWHEKGRLVRAHPVNFCL